MIRTILRNWLNPNTTPFFLLCSNSKRKELSSAFYLLNYYKEVARRSLSTYITDKTAKVDDVVPKEERDVPKKYVMCLLYSVANLAKWPKIALWYRVGKCRNVNILKVQHSLLFKHILVFTNMRLEMHGLRVIIKVGNTAFMVLTSSFDLSIFVPSHHVSLGCG